MATLRRIDAIHPIPNADAIECAVIGGWKVVAKKGEYQPGDLAVYCEIDSWIPNALAPFLSKKEPKEYNGVKGERLRTVRLRGQLSQGLLLPLTVLQNDGAWIAGVTVDDGTDVSDVLGIQKWDVPIPAQLAGQVKGNFPSRIPKTDQERVQNLSKELGQYAYQVFEVTEKLEGSSMTCYMIDNEFGVCSRNMDLKRDENNTFWKVAIELDIEAKLRKARIDNAAIQGELIGPGIQGNIYNLTKHTFHAFDIYDIESGEYLLPESRQAVIKELDIPHVPVLGYIALQADMDYLLETAEGKSLLNQDQEREGVVFKHFSVPFTFKVISNKYLLKQ